MVERRYNLRAQLTTAAERSHTSVLEQRVDRVLRLLSDQQLVTDARDAGRAPGELERESVDLPHVWEDERVRARVCELAEQGVEVEIEERERTVAGMTFTVWVLSIRY